MSNYKNLKRKLYVIEYIYIVCSKIELYVIDNVTT